MNNCFPLRQLCMFSPLPIHMVFFVTTITVPSTQMKIFLDKLGVVSISPIQRQCIEIDTQDSRKRWKEERQKRLRSSSFGTVCKSTEKANKAKLAKRLVQGREFRCAATTHGITYEHVAVQRYEDNLSRN